MVSLTIIPIYLSWEPSECFTTELWAVLRASTVDLVRLVFVFPMENTVIFTVSLLMDSLNV